MAAMKNHFQTLGVAETASADEIKKAYRKLAKKLHPDVTGGDKVKEAKFKEISEAYDVLSDEKKRKDYDASRRNPFAAGGRGGGFSGGDPTGGNIDLDELFAQFGGRGGRGRVRVDPGGPGGAQGGNFADMFGNMFTGEQRGRAQAPSQAKGEDVHARLEIELPEAALGAEKTISVDGHRSLKIKIPAGITAGKTIRLTGQGQPGRGGPGDLLVEVFEKPHPRFRRQRDGAPDIEVDVPVALEVAILGGKADVPTLEATTLSLTIPPGTTSGKKLRLRGKGAIVAGGAKGAKSEKPGEKPGEPRGDLYAVLSIQLPETMSPEAKSALEAFAKLIRT